MFQHSSHIDRIKSELDDPSVMAQVTYGVEKTLGKKFEIEIVRHSQPRLIPQITKVNNPRSSHGGCKKE